MKNPAFLFRLCLMSFCLVMVSAAVIETNVEPAQAVVPAVAAPPVEVVIPELNELREQLRTMQRSNEEMQRSSEQASQKWEAVVQQNSALSNVLTGLQQTLVAQKEHQLELGKQSNALTLKVISGAAVAVLTGHSASRPAAWHVTVSRSGSTARALLPVHPI